MSVREPSTCQYEAELKTPLACPVDSFLGKNILNTPPPPHTYIYIYTYLSQ